MRLETFFEKFELFADAPDATAKMRELLLQLAVQGKLVKQDPKELSARECIHRANKPLVDVALDESVETPVGWIALPLGCLVASNTGGGTPSKQNPNYWSGSIPWASVKDVQSDKYLVSTIDSITEEGLKDSSSNLIPPNRLIVVTRMGLGKLAINTLHVAINQDLRAIEPTSALDLNFAYLLFKSLKMVGLGVTVKGITVDKLHAMPVLAPPLAEQKRIVAKVDELMALCDRLEAQQQERQTQHTALARASLSRFADAPTPANLDFLFHESYAIEPADLRKSILTLAVQGKLVPQDPNDEPPHLSFPKLAAAAVESDDSFPAHWLRVPLGETGEWRGGGTPSKSRTDFWKGKIPWVSPKDMKVLHISDALDHISKAALENSSVRMIPTGSLLMVVRGMILARAFPVALTTKEVTINQDMKALLPFEPETKEYLLVALRAFEPNFLAAIERSSHGTCKLKTEFVHGFTMPIPPLAEQRRIVAKVEQLMALVDQLEAQLTASRTAAANLLEAVVTELTAQN